MALDGKQHKQFNRNNNTTTKPRILSQAREKKKKEDEHWTTNANESRSDPLDIPAQRAHKKKKRKWDNKWTNGEKLNTSGECERVNMGECEALSRGKWLNEIKMNFSWPKPYGILCAHFAFLHRLWAQPLAIHWKHSFQIDAILMKT